MTPSDRGLLHGTVELLILRTLARNEPMHGFAMSRDLRSRSRGVVELKDAALYQALHRMEAGGLVESEWGRSEKGKRAKFYRLKAAGRKRLERERSAWARWVEGVERVLDPAPDET